MAYDATVTAEDVRASPSAEHVEYLLSDRYGLKDPIIQEMPGFYSRNYKVSVEDFRNKYIQDLWPHGYIFKILKQRDSHRIPLGGQDRVRSLLGSKGIMCPQTVTNVYGNKSSMEYMDAPTDKSGSDVKHRIYLLTYIPGNMMYDVPQTPSLLYKTGAYLARLDKELIGFQDSSMEYVPLFALSQAHRITDYTGYLTDTDAKKLVWEIASAFTAKVMPILHKLRPGVIHGDFHSQNVVARRIEGTNDYDVQGVIDFDDSMQAFHIFEVAIAMMHTLAWSKDMDGILAAGYLLAGYQKTMQLPQEEISLLKVLVAARFVQVQVLSENALLEDAGNSYVASIMEGGWEKLKQFWKTPDAEVLATWK